MKLKLHAAVIARKPVPAQAGKAIQKGIKGLKPQIDTDTHRSRHQFILSVFICGVY